MFREADGAFVPFQHIWTDNHFVLENHVLYFMPPKKYTDRQVRLIASSIVCLMALVSVIYWRVWLFDMVIDWQVWLFNMVIDNPLRALYRNGPLMIGWGGESLPRICGHMAGNNDEAFWIRHMEECNRTFSQKEAAMVRQWRPFACMFVSFVAYYIMGKRQVTVHHIYR